ncbi:MAG: sensor histidine kinase [Clostridia bacterium]|nr:sensor histidine kinase [Clostridia bacterium]
MKELSLNILDIAENSAKANATFIEIGITEAEDTLVLTIADDGCGMSAETVESVINPFFTTRTTRKVGLGIPLLKLAAEQTGGELDIKSKMASDTDAEHGTVVRALFYKNHVDCTPLGDVAQTLITLIQGHPDIDFVFVHKKGDKSVALDTRELRVVLEDVPLHTYEVIMWIKDNLEEQYQSF